MKQEDLKVGEFYYYAKDQKKYECIEVGEKLSLFKDEKTTGYQFYNEDIYKTPWNKS